MFTNINFFLTLFLFSNIILFRDDNLNIHWRYTNEGSLRNAAFKSRHPVAMGDGEKEVGKMAGKNGVKVVEDEISITNTIDVTNEQKITLSALDNCIHNLVTSIDRKTLENYTAANYKNTVLKSEIVLYAKP